MAFTYTLEKGVAGNLKTRYGTFTSTSGSTGGAISSGLKVVKTVLLTNSTASVTSAPSATVSGGTVTVVSGANATGYFEIKGY